VLKLYPDGGVRGSVQRNGARFKLFDGQDPDMQPGVSSTNKRAVAVLEHIKAQQAAYPAHGSAGGSPGASVYPPEQHPRSQPDLPRG